MVQTDADGNYQFTGLYPGRTYELNFRRDGIEFDRQTVEVISSEGSASARAPDVHALNAQPTPPAGCTMVDYSDLLAQMLALGKEAHDRGIECSARIIQATRRRQRALATLTRRETNRLKGAYQQNVEHTSFMPQIVLRCPSGLNCINTDLSAILKAYYADIEHMKILPLRFAARIRDVSPGKAVYSVRLAATERRLYRQAVVLWRSYRAATAGCDGAAG